MILLSQCVNIINYRVYSKLVFQEKPANAEAPKVVSLNSKDEKKSLCILDFTFILISIQLYSIYFLDVR